MPKPDPVGGMVVLLVTADDRLAGRVVEALSATDGDRFEVVRVDRLEEATRRAEIASAFLLDLPDGALSSVLALQRLAPALPAIVLVRATGRQLESDAVSAGAHDVVGYGELDLLGRALRLAIHRFRARPDIEERAQAEERVRLLEAAVEQSTDAITICTADADDPIKHRVVYVNPAFTEMIGYAPDEILGQSPFITLQSPEIGPEQTKQMFAEMTAGRTLTGENLAYDKSRAEYMMAWKVQPLRDEDGKVTHVVAIQRDVTEQRRLEEQLRQSQKMEAVGRLAGGVAHDFNNLLTAIIGYDQLLLLRLGPDHPEREAVEQIEKAAKRAASLTNQLLAFSRRQVLQPRVIDLNQVVRNVEQMLRRLIGEDIELVIRLSASPAKVKADPGQLEQVLLNLSINARDAMPNGGRLTLNSASVEIDAELGAELGGEPGDYIRLRVRDSGVGMDELTRAQIFEPFFTTKDHEGTGLGLATVYGIVKQSGGFIAVESTAGEGTTFDVFLPWVEHLPIQEIEHLGAPGVEKGTESVLLAEDDDSVRRLIAAVLEERGYRVSVAADGEEALGIAGDYAKPIDLLISDIVMPDMRGPELDRRIVSGRPEIKTLFISGYADGSFRGEFDADVPFLQKPFSPDTLARKVREVLDRPRPRSGPLVPAASAP